MIGFVSFMCMILSSAQADEHFEANVYFRGENNETGASFNLSLLTISSMPCDPNEMFTIIVHDFKQNSSAFWISVIGQDFLLYRGGCVIAVDYSRYSISQYSELLAYFDGIKNVLVKFMKAIGNPAQQLCFGQGFGARLCEKAGIQFSMETGSKIDRMELCDPAGPGFTVTDDPKPAAKNVACVNTSKDKGTGYYNCHQNFRMGECGKSQAAVGPGLSDHNLCVYFYHSAFTNNFAANNVNNCVSKRMINNPPDAVRMGYNAAFDREVYRGDVFIATAKYYNYVVVKGNVNNQP